MDAAIVKLLFYLAEVSRLTAPSYPFQSTTSHPANATTTVASASTRTIPPFVLSSAEAKHGVKLLQNAGMRKLNIIWGAGGELFLQPHRLTDLLRYWKKELRLESMSIVSNRSKICESRMRVNSQWLDMLAISCDWFNAATNIKIDRGDDGGNLDRLFRMAECCRTHGVKFELSTVVNTRNWDEDISANIEKLAAFRWKVFQCLIVAGRHHSAERLRGAREFLVMDKQWRTIYDCHKHLDCYIPGC